MISEVYFVKAGNGAVKIGYSADFDRRFGEVMKMLPEKMEVLCRVPGDRRTEFYFHRKLQRSRIVGEWFRPDEDVVDTVQTINEKGILAIPDEYRATSIVESADSPIDDMKDQCREYCIAIAGPRVGSEKIKDLIKRVSDITGVTRRTVQMLWYREAGNVFARDYARLREVFEAREARLYMARASLVSDRAVG